MNRRHVAAAVMGALVLMLAVILPQAGAQSGGTRQVLTGQTVTWNDEWSPLPEVSVADENVELFALSHGASIVGYGGTAFPVGASDVRDELLKGFATDQNVQQVDRGAYDNVSYSIDLSTSEGITLATFALVIENPANTTMAMLISAPEQFEETMTAAQAGIAIDGAPIFDGVDAAQMQATITAAQGLTAPAATPAADEGDGLGDLGDAITGTPAPVAAEPADVALPNAVTLASSGVEVRHSDDWSVQRQEERSLALGTVATPPVLVSVIDLGSVSGGVDPKVLAGGLTQQVESLADAEVVAALSPSPDRVVIVFRDPEGDATLYRIYDIALDPTATTAVTLIVDVNDLDTALALVDSTIQVDGQPVLSDLRSLVPEIFAGA